MKTLGATIERRENIVGCNANCRVFECLPGGLARKRGSGGTERRGSPIPPISFHRSLVMTPSLSRTNCSTVAPPIWRIRLSSKHTIQSMYNGNRDDPVLSVHVLIVHCLTISECVARKSSCSLRGGVPGWKPNLAVDAYHSLQQPHSALDKDGKLLSKLVLNSQFSRGLFLQNLDTCGRYSERKPVN
jgi:hypothetical protein